MITLELISQLKQVNVSRDKSKTQERVKNAFSAASRKDKQAIEKMTGQKRTSIYRVAKIGSISAKILLPLSEILNISPYWFTGESDVMEACSDALILKFLEEHGYKFSPQKAARAKRNAVKQAVKPAEAPVEAPADDNTITVTITLSGTPQMREAAERLNAENAGQLLQALILRANAGGNAEQLWDVVKLCLLS